MPDANVLPGCSFRYGRGGVYVEDGVTRARSAAVDGGSVLGSGTVVGDGSSVLGSVLGRRCMLFYAMPLLCYAMLC